MSGLKKSDGAASQHATNKQFGKGPGVANHPLKKSTANPNPPMVKEGKEHAKTVSMAPKVNASVGDRRIIQDEIKPAGRNSTGSTFTAPRSKESSDPLMTGYTKPGKM